MPPKNFFPKFSTSILDICSNLSLFISVEPIRKLVRRILKEELAEAEALKSRREKEIKFGQEWDPMDTKEDRLRRFNEAIYRHYVETNQYGELKHATKEEFHNKLSDKVDNVKTIKFEKTVPLGVRIRTPHKSRAIHRLADEKDIWLSKYNHKLGEVWKEDWMESYWINERD